MGVRATYIISQTDPDAFLEALGLACIGTAEQVPNSDWAGRLESGWTVVRIGDEDFPQRAIGRLERLSRQGDIVVTHINETVGFQDTLFLSEGTETWRVTSGDESSPDDLSITCEENLPRDVRDHLETLQTAEEMSDAPADVMGIIAGLRYDDLLEASELDRVRLVEVPAPRLRDYGPGAVFWHWFNRNPLLGLGAVVLCALLLVVPLLAVVGGILGNLVDLVLGDWGETCLLNCKDTTR